MTQMIGSAPMGSRKRYQAEQVLLQEEIAKAAGAVKPNAPAKPSTPTPASAGSVGGSRVSQAQARIPKPMSALATPAPKPLKPMGTLMPTGNASPKPVTPQVAKADKLRRKGKFQRTRGSGLVRDLQILSKEPVLADNPAMVSKSVMTSAALLKPAVSAQARLLEGANKLTSKTRLSKAPRSKVGRLVQTGKTNARSGLNHMALDPARTLRPFEEMTKAAPLKTSVSDDDARKLVDRHGLKGPLPKNLDRQQKMAAYEARYVSAGGKKAEKWQHRAQMADKVKNAGLAGVTAAGAGVLASKTKSIKALRGTKIGSKLHTKPGHLETAAVASGTIGGAGELYAGHARRKRSSYASAPAGVAASALRRMQDYTP